MTQYEESERNINNKKLTSIVWATYFAEIAIGLIITGLLIIPFFITINIPFGEMVINIKLEQEHSIIVIITFLYFVAEPTIRALFCSQNKIIKKELMEQNIDDYAAYNEYKTAKRYGSLRISELFSFVQPYLKLSVIPNSQIVWVYKRETTKTITKINNRIDKRKIEEISRRKRYAVVIRTLQRKEYIIPLYNESRVDEVIEMYQQHDHIVVGYSKELNRLYRYQFKEFLDIVYDRFKNKDDS